MRCHVVLSDYNLAAAQRQLVVNALQVTTTLEEAARVLGIRVVTLRRLMQRHQIKPE